VCYNASMSSLVIHAKVSNRGQTSLPAQLRHRWGIETGGDVAFVDLGDSALILPGGMDRAKAELKRVLAERYNSGLAAISDPDLADQ
jgi:bifunctional DNA-binding transcriptional regulator/antitoxin component of YhaV-PrlF toxin-antitoxin module